jgi:hypothetical protein
VSFVFLKLLVTTIVFILSHSIRSLHPISVIKKIERKKKRKKSKKKK